MSGGATERERRAWRLLVWIQVTAVAAVGVAVLVVWLLSHVWDLGSR